MKNRFFPNYDAYIITSPFGMRTLNGATKMHNGIDLVATKDGKTGLVDQIMAHTGGTVASVGYNDSCGYYINISVDASTTMAYYHLREMSPKKKGDPVKTGEIIGYMGATGNVTGAHLHWGIKENGKWIDPAPYLDKDYNVETEPVRKDFSIGMRTLRYGDRGEDVRALQILLVGRGESLSQYGTDADFGKETENAVKHFQLDNKLESDGICGVKTWTKLLRME